MGKGGTSDNMKRLNSELILARKNHVSLKRSAAHTMSILVSDV